MLFAEGEIALNGRRVARRLGRRLVTHHHVMPGFGLVFGAPDIFGLLNRIGTEDGIQKHIHRHIRHFLQVTLKALAIAAVRIFENGHFAFTVAAHHREGVFQRQRAEVDRAEFLNPLFRQVAFGFGVDQVALDQKIAFRVGVENLAVVDAQFIQAVHRRFTHFVDLRQVGQPLNQVLADHCFLRHGGAKTAHHHAGQNDLLK